MDPWVQRGLPAQKRRARHRSAPRPRKSRTIRVRTDADSSSHSPQRGPIWTPARYGQPAANSLRKHWKSLAFNTGAVVEPSQLAYGSAAAKALRKHWKSLAFRIGALDD